jgi:hypothetical protein
MHVRKWAPMLVRGTAVCKPATGTITAPVSHPP